MSPPMPPQQIASTTTTFWLALSGALLPACTRTPGPAATPAAAQDRAATRTSTRPDQTTMLEARLDGMLEVLRDKDAEIKRLRTGVVSAPQAEFRNRPGEAFYTGGAVLVARDPATGDFGWIAVSICPAAAGQMVLGNLATGAVAMLGIPNGALQQRVLAGLASGKTAAQAVQAELPDPQEHRNLQLGAFAASGPGAVFQGLSLHKEAGFADGAECFALGCEILTPDLPKLLCAEFTKAKALPFPERLLAAMREARLAPLRAPGGRPGISSSASDRPILSAAMVVLRPNSSLDGTTDRMVDVRVDLDAEPIAALDRVYQAWEKASLIARLKAFLKEAKDPNSPRTKADRAWLDRIRVGG